MKVRLRVGQITHRIEVQHDFDELLVKIADLVGCPVNDVRLGLNKKDALEGPPSATLASLGICSGDLLHLLAPQLPDPVQCPQHEEIGSATPVVIETMPSEGVSMQAMERRSGPSQAAALQNSSSLHLLHRVLAANASSASSADRLLLLVHAVMLDSGFESGSQVAVDPASLPMVKRVTASTCTLAYLLSSGSEPQGGQANVCRLKCSALGRHLVVAGSVSGSTPRHVTLAARQEQGPDQAAADPAGDAWQHDWEAVRPLWVRIKDELALPLLADAAAQGLCAPPTSLLALDAEALDTILNLLPAHDLAAVAATCRQLRATASADPLWRRFVEEDFPALAGPERRSGWKALYGACHRDREAARERRLAAFFSLHPQLRPVPGFRGGNPFMPAPGPGGIIGGEYDRLPFGGFGGRQPPGQRGSLFNIRHGGSRRSHVNLL